MGRYADELRKMTRDQGGGPVEAAPVAPTKTREGRRLGPLVAFLGILALAGFGWLLMQQMMADSKLQDCVMSGRKNCAPVDPSNP